MKFYDVKQMVLYLITLPKIPKNMKILNGKYIKVNYFFVFDDVSLS
jgi:hypothetical protein